MYERVFLSSYHIKIKNKKEQNEQILEKFNGQTDFFDVLSLFFTDIYKNPRKINNDEENNTNLSFTLLNLPTILTEDRVIYGYIETAIIGQNIKVKNHLKNTEVFKGNRETDAIYKTVFFYCKLPINKKNGYLILQRRARYGVKTALSRLLQIWLKEKGFTESRPEIRSVYNSKIFFNMIENGNLRKVNFVLNHVPSTIDDYMTNNEAAIHESGQTITTFSSKTTLSNWWKSFIFKKYTKGQQETLVELVETDNENDNFIKYDEIAVELELNGTKKTFYANNKSRVAPEREVSSELVYSDGEPTLESLLMQCEEIIADTFEVNNHV